MLSNGDIVEIEADAVRCVARVRDARDGRLHVALELGEYLPWIDEAVVVRSGEEVHEARILHVGATTALLQLMAPEPASVSTPSANLHSETRDIDDGW